MNVSNDTPAVDPIQYFASPKFAQDLVEMAKLRDELAKRQGAINAVNDAHADRESAKVALATAKEQADALLADAKAKNLDSKAKAKALDERADALKKAEEAFALASAEREIALASKENTAAANEKRLAEFDSLLADKSAKLDADRAALEARIKAFQDKVASINI